MSVRVVKMCDMPGIIAAKVFQMLNISHVKFTMKEKSLCGRVIITDVEPKKLIFPEGWYYDKGYFTNKGTSSDGLYSAIAMKKSDDTSWRDIAKYSTLE